MIKSNNRRRNTKPMGLSESESTFVKSVTDGTVTTEKVKSFVVAMLQSGDYNHILSEYFNGMYANEHAEQVGTIIENEDLIQKQEETLSKLNRSINEKEKALSTDKLTEEYIKRNSLKAQKENLNANSTSSTSINESTSTNSTPKVMTGDEELAVKQYMKSKHNFEFLKERMAKGSTFDVALVECGADRYTIDLITRGIKSLNEGVELLNIRSNHLF